MNNGSCVESVVNIQRNKSRSDDDDDEAEPKQQVESILVSRNYYTGG